MSLFGPPNISKLTARRDLEGLVEALSFQKDVGVRVAAARALQALGDTRGIQPLTRELQDKDWRVCDAAAQSLAAVGAVEPLAGALHDAVTTPAPPVRRRNILRRSARSGSGMSGRFDRFRVAGQV